MKTIIKLSLFLIAMIVYACPSVYGQKETIFSSEEHDPIASALLHTNASFHTILLNHDLQNNQHTKEYYLQKSKRQKTAAWILLGGGTVLGAIGLIEAENNFAMFGLGDSKKYNFFVGMTIAGIVADLVSIPLFISSSKNKKRAVELSVSNEKLDFTPNTTGNDYPALTLRMNF